MTSSKTSTSDGSLEAQVLIVGAGPVGLCLAIDLAQRGVDVLVAEVRSRLEPPSVKSNHVAARTMEIFRRLGMAADVRNAGLPDDYPNDVAYRTSFLGEELSRIRIPSRRDRFTVTDGPDGWWPTPEPSHRINQIFLEPILFKHAEATRGLRIANRLRVDDFAQDSSRVVVSATDLDTGAAMRIACQYVIGCDGAKSTIRKVMGVLLAGTDVVGRVQSTYFRAPSLLKLLAREPAWGTFALNPRRCGNVYAIDGRETWLLHNYLLPHETDFEAIDRDWAIRQILGVDSTFAYEVISKEDWIGRRLVADRFRNGRAFICGDASHLWIPMAGYGMNAGIADAMDLSWLLAARIQRWGGESVLDAYEAERLPITEQVSRFAMNHALELQAKRQNVPAAIEAEGPEGEAARRRAGAALYELNVRQYCCAGLNFGYYYDASPLIAYDGERAPAYAMDSFVPSTVPGCRTPHFWLDDGRSLYDAMGPGYTLLRFDHDASAAALEHRAREHGMPLTVLDLPAERQGEFRHRMLLSRPDQHVAWRGDILPTDCDSLVAKLTGR